MIEVNGVLISILTLMIAIIGTIFGIYVRLSNQQTDHETRLKSLEKTKDHVYEKLEAHDQKINDALIDIKDGIQRLELMIEKLRK